MIYGAPTVKLRLRFKSIKYHPPPSFTNTCFPTFALEPCLVSYILKTKFHSSFSREPKCDAPTSWAPDQSKVDLRTQTCSKFSSPPWGVWEGSPVYIILMEWNPKWGKIMHIIIWWYSKCASTNELSGFSMCYLKNCREIFITNLLIVQKITW